LTGVHPGGLIIESEQEPIPGYLKQMAKRDKYGLNPDLSIGPDPGALQALPNTWQRPAAAYPMLKV